MNNRPTTATAKKTSGGWSDFPGTAKIALVLVFTIALATQLLSLSSYVRSVEPTKLWLYLAVFFLVTEVIKKRNSVVIASVFATLALIPVKVAARLLYSASTTKIVLVSFVIVCFVIFMLTRKPAKPAAKKSTTAVSVQEEQETVMKAVAEEPKTDVAEVCQEVEQELELENEVFDPEVEEEEFSDDD